MMQNSLGRGEVGRKSVTALTQQQERALARQWQREGDRGARNLLVQSQFGYALTVARRCNRRGTSIEELLAEASLGLIQAANRFDPECGCRFFTYAKYWVRVYITRWASQRSAVLRRSRLLSKVRREWARAFSLVGDGLEARGIVAERLNLSERAIEPLLCAIEQHEVSFDALAPEQIASGSQLRESEIDPEQALLQRVESVRRQRMVSEVLGSLDTRESRIVADRLMADSDCALTLEQLGKEFGVSRERVRQLEERLKQKLARQLQSLAHPEREVAA